MRCCSLAVSITLSGRLNSQMWLRICTPPLTQALSLQSNTQTRTHTHAHTPSFDTGSFRAITSHVPDPPTPLPVPPPPLSLPLPPPNPCTPPLITLSPPPPSSSSYIITSSSSDSSKRECSVRVALPSSLGIAPSSSSLPGIPAAARRHVLGRLLLSPEIEIPLDDACVCKAARRWARTHVSLSLAPTLKHTVSHARARTNTQHSDHKPQPAPSGGVISLSMDELITDEPRLALRSSAWRVCMWRRGGGIVCGCVRGRTHRPGARVWVEGEGRDVLLRGCFSLPLSIPLSPSPSIPPSLLPSPLHPSLSPLSTCLAESPS